MTVSLSQDHPFCLYYNAFGRWPQHPILFFSQWFPSETEHEVAFSLQAMVFPVVMYECESWTIKKVEHRRIDTFELWCWIRDLRVPWTARRSNQSILKEINPEYSLEGLMLKLLYFGHLMQRADSFEKTLMLGKTEGKRIRGQQRKRWLDSITSSMDMNLSKLQKIVEKRGVRGAAVHGLAFRHNWVTEQQKWNMSSFPSLLFS